MAHAMVCFYCIYSPDHVLGGYGLWLWNPFTRKSKRLPICLHYHKVHCKFGFGYDPLSNDYKVVYISTYKTIKTWVFSLGSNTWRKIPLFIPFRTVNLMCSTAVSVDGALHWLSYDMLNKSIEIVTFDISEEKFVNLMPAIQLSGHKIFLQVLEGSLVYCRCVNDLSRYVEM